jgi:MFS family permease
VFSWGLTAIQSGLMMMPGTLIVAICMPIVGWLSDKSSPRFLSLMGMASSMLSIVQQVGGAIGIAILSTVGLLRNGS